MSEEPEEGEEGDPAEEGDELSLPDLDGPSSKGGKVKLMAIVAALVVVLAGGGAAVFFSGALDSLSGGEEDGDSASVELTVPSPPVYYDLPELLVDLKTGRCRSPFIKFQAVVEVSQDFVPRLKEVELQVIDQLQAFVRQHQHKEMVGKAGTELLRAGILRITNRAMEPQKALGVLFREIILQ